MSKSKARRFADLLGVSSIFNEDATQIRAVAVVDQTANTDLKSFTTNLDSEKASNTYVNTLLANTNAYIASVQSDVDSNEATERSALANTNAYIASVDSARASNLANTNAYIASISATERSALANTNAYIASVQSDVDSNEATELLHLANTNAYIATKVNTSTFNSALANTNAYVASVSATERSALANTNAFIATKVNTSTFNSALANTNAFIASVNSTRASNLANTNAYIASVQSDVNSNEATERAALANTNAYIASQVSRINLVNTNLTGTNTAIRTLVSDRIQVSNAVSTFATWSALTATNTSIRSAISTEVANLVDSAPSTLNTLNELAAALGDNPNFATTLTTNLGQKLGATASVTLTGAVTGSGSFSGNSVSITTTATSDPTITLAGDLTGSVTLTNLGNGTLTATVVDDSHNHIISNVDGLQTALDGKLSLTGGTLTGNLNFGDNVKAQFGAGSDLQIYHDGTNSYVSDQGTGNLILAGNNLQIMNGTATANYVTGTNGAGVSLHYNGPAKLATTSTGIDVTGTVTADGLTVSNTTQNDALGIAQVVNTTADDLASSTLTVKNHNGTGQFMQWRTFGMRIGSRIITNNGVGDVVFTHGNDVEKMRLTSTGLGIGTIPSSPLHVKVGANQNLEVDSNGSELRLSAVNDARSTNPAIRFQAESYKFYGAGGVGPRATLDSSGNLGLGNTPSPTSAAGYTAFELGASAGTGLTGNNGDLYVTENAYVSGGAWKYAASSIASAQYNLGGGVHRWFNAAAGTANINITWTQAMTLDASGNLLVGKTSSDTNVEGAVLFADSATGASGAFTSDGIRTIIANRKTSDGEIISIRKDGTTVGSIGSQAGVNLNIGNASVGLVFSNGGSEILPWNVSTNTASNGLISLGDATRRFKDLYLSGVSYVDTSSRAPIFYDSNNTAYYADPASTSVFNVFNAVTKSFLIDHPTKPNMKLRYACLEGPENGVYVRGRLTGSNVIELPDYWLGLVHEDSITVSLTPVGRQQDLYVVGIHNNEVYISGENVDCFYVVYGERKDVERLVVEF